ncbi:hypothetical protein C8R46DRAFT_879409 [Mycena filopes]|nr:hypothetical protein C8R46DRAFT_879409 [Mycena filopes]
MRKMVNSMSAKMEIGSPMASLYLLGNPDYYSSHVYVPFAWRQYVQFVRAHWIREMKHSSLNLYEWIQCSKKKKRSVKQKQNFDDEIRLSKHSRPTFYKAAMKKIREEDGEEGTDSESEYGSGMEDDPDELDLHAPSQAGDYDGESDWETDEEDDENKPSQRAFLVEHPMFRSHSVACTMDNVYSVIPNFIGGAIPRSDKGDRAGYCMAVLTLLKPWRSPADLKDATATWDQAFQEHQFSDRQSQMIRNFDVRYECNDARDDHFAQMKKKLADAKKEGTNLWPSGFMSYKDKFAGDLNEMDYGSDDESLHDYDDDAPKGRRTLQLMEEAKDMKNIMQSSGWLDRSVDGVQVVDTDALMLPARP